MKYIGVTIILLMFSVRNTNAQLSPIAQAIYDSCIANTPANVTYALSNGAQIISTPDQNSFYLQWFPAGAIPSQTPLVVTLHGSKGNAFNEFKSWHSAAQSHHCGVIAIQYNKYTNILDYANGYFHDDTIYSYIDSALTRIAYASQRALLHGFSLGSARTYAVIYNDMQSGKNYFCTTISNAGKIDLTYPLYAQLDTKTNVFAGKHWNLFCGPPEPPIIGGACDGLDFTQTWLKSKGAIVDIYIQDSLLGHNGFQQAASEHYKDTMLNIYLNCFNGATSIQRNHLEVNNATIYPNPFSLYTTVNINEKLENATVVVYNVLGEEVKTEKNISGSSFVFNRDQLANGFYFIYIMQGHLRKEIGRIIIKN
jgi:hypothetical protein